MAISVVLDPTLRIEPAVQTAVSEEIKGLIRVYADGRVERFPVVPFAAAEDDQSEGRVTCRDVVIDEKTNVWARLYVPKTTIASASSTATAIAYFHGGGFCVGSAAWSCYHEFVTRLALQTGCLVMSVEYRLAPECPLPAAYEDAARAIDWLLNQTPSPNRVILMGDSAGANIVYNIANSDHCQDIIGSVLIQPFFGGEARTLSESSSSGGGGALSLSASDAYWRMALPPGTTRDHPCCNPLGGLLSRPASRMLVCVSELDILRDRTLEFCDVLGSVGDCAVRCEVYERVGHAFHILGSSRLARDTTSRMIEDIKDFISTC